MCGCKNANTLTTLERRVESCDGVYSELSDYDKKVVELIMAGNKDSILLEINKQLRNWITNLSTHCPPSGDVKVIKDYIDVEYAKHIQQ